MSSQRRPNGNMRKLLAEASWTEAALARTVNKLAAEAGIQARYDRTSVSHWLSGIRPREPVPGLIAEAFGRRLGRMVTTGDAGLGSASAATSSHRTLQYPAAALASLASQRRHPRGPGAGGAGVSPRRTSRTRMGT